MESNLDYARQIGITLAEDERIRSVLIGMRADLNNVERFGMRAQDADQVYAQVFQRAILGVIYQALERGLIAIPAPAEDGPAEEAPMPATGDPDAAGEARRIHNARGYIAASATESIFRIVNHWFMEPKRAQNMMPAITAAIEEAIDRAMPTALEANREAAAGWVADFRQARQMEIHVASIQKANADLREQLINFRVRSVQYQGALRHLQTLIQLAHVDPENVDGQEWDVALALINQELGLEGEAE